MDHYRLRWFLELLQNATDVGATRVSLEITGETLDYKHDAKSFTTDDLLCLTRGGSSNEDDPKCDAKGPHEFGTGFLCLALKSL